MIHFFSPLRLPFSLSSLDRIPYWVRALGLAALRVAVALSIGPEAYFLVRGRFLIAAGVFLAKLGFAGLGQDERGRRWAVYLALGAEAVQCLLSLYVGFRLANAKPTVELVEEIELRDEQGRVLTTCQQKVSPDRL